MTEQDPTLVIHEERRGMWNLNLHKPDGLLHQISFLVCPVNVWMTNRLERETKKYNPDRGHDRAELSLPRDSGHAQADPGDREDCQEHGMPGTTVGIEIEKASRAIACEGKNQQGCKLK